jgi:hypothetical protein
MTTRLTVTIPGPLPRELSPNASWKVPGGMKARLKREMAELWHYSALNTLWHLLGLDTYATTTQALFPNGPVRCQITYYRPKGGKEWDKDNLLATCKFGLDALQRVGVVSNDRQLDYQPVKQDRDPVGVGYLVVELEGEAT